jgi:hypothetical protein
MNIGTLNPPEYAISPIAPLERVRGLSYDLAIDLSHEVLSPVGFGNEATDSAGYGHGVEFTCFGLTTEREVELSDGFHVSGHGLSDLNHGLFIIVRLARISVPFKLTLF